jgi:hypothetical protein
MKYNNKENAKPIGTMNGLGFVDVKPAPRPAPDNIIAPPKVNNSNLVNGGMGGLGSTQHGVGLPHLNSPYSGGQSDILQSPTGYRPISPVKTPQIPMPMRGTKRKMGSTRTNIAIWTGVGALLVTAGFLFNNRFGADDMLEENYVEPGDE